MFERFVDGPQGRLNLSETQDGDRTPALFVHSDGGNLHHWDRIRTNLKDRPTAAFDRRGHGRSEFPRDESFAADAAAADITAIADALGYKRFFLIGHSGGALVSFAFASMAPDRLVGLVLVDPPGDPAKLPPGMMDEVMQKMHGESYASTLDNYYRSIAGENGDVTERILADARATNKGTILGQMEANARFRPADFLNYEGPALSIIQSQFDVDGALHRIARMEHVTIDGAGHWIHLGAPERFLDALEDFFHDFEQPKDGEVQKKAESRSGAAD